MAQAQLKTQQILGGSLITGQTSVAVLGTTAGGSTVYSLDPDVLQNTQWESAVNNNVIVQNPDPATVSPYNPTTTYAVNNYVKDTVTNLIYVSLINGNVGNALTDGAAWKIVNYKFFPYQETINSIGYVTSNNVAAIQQEGILPWLATTAYNQYALVKDPGTSQIYESIFAGVNQGNALTNPTYWTIWTGLTLDSPNFTGIPTAPTAPPGTNTTQIATTAYVDTAVGTGSYYNIVTYRAGNTGTYIIPNNVVYVKITLIGGGGGAGGTGGTATWLFGLANGYIAFGGSYSNPGLQNYAAGGSSGISGTPAIVGTILNGMAGRDSIFQIINPGVVRPGRGGWTNSGTGGGYVNGGDGGWLQILFFNNIPTSIPFSVGSGGSSAFGSNTGTGADGVLIIEEFA